MDNPSELQQKINHRYLFFRFHNEGGDAAYAMYPVCKGKQLSCSNSILNRMGEFDHGWFHLRFIHKIVHKFVQSFFSDLELGL